LGSAIQVYIKCWQCHSHFTCMPCHTFCKLFIRIHIYIHIFVITNYLEPPALYQHCIYIQEDLSGLKLFLFCWWLMHINWNKALKTLCVQHASREVLRLSNISVTTTKRQTGFQASPVRSMRTALLWVITQQVWVIPFIDISGQLMYPIFKDTWSEDGINRLSQNVSKKLPLPAVL
jgi:hypothetical protein